MYANVSCFLTILPSEREAIQTKLVSKIQSITGATACDMSHATSNHSIVCMIHPNDSRLLPTSELAGLLKKVSETIHGAIEFRKEPIDVIVQLSDQPVDTQNVARLSA